MTLGITLDKSLAKTLVAAAGVATPRGFLVVSGDEPVLHGFGFPAVVKPVHEGSSKGITSASVVEDEESAPPGAGRGRALRTAGALRGIRRRP